MPVEDEVIYGFDSEDDLDRVRDAVRDYEKARGLRPEQPNLGRVSAVPIDVKITGALDGTVGYYPAVFVYETEDENGDTFWYEDEACWAKPLNSGETLTIGMRYKGSVQRAREEDNKALVAVTVGGGVGSTSPRWEWIKVGGFDVGADASGYVQVWNPDTEAYEDDLTQAVQLRLVEGSLFLEGKMYWAKLDGTVIVAGFPDPFPLYHANGHDEVIFQAEVCVDGVVVPVCTKLTLPAPTTYADTTCP